MECVAGARQEDELCDRLQGGGEQRQEDPRGSFPGKVGNNKINTAALELRVHSISKRDEKGGARDGVRKRFRALRAEGANAKVRFALVEPSACGPSKCKGAQCKTGEEGGALEGLIRPLRAS